MRKTSFAESLTTIFFVMHKATAFKFLTDQKPSLLDGVKLSICFQAFWNKSETKKKNSVI